jgi:hypothetical protein
MEKPEGKRQPERPRRGWMNIIKIDLRVMAEVLAANPEVPGSIPGAATYPEKQWVCNGVHSALVKINEELLERKLADPV